jgi:hypothetical protein
MMQQPDIETARLLVEKHFEDIFESFEEVSKG